MRYAVFFAVCCSIALAQPPCLTGHRGGVLIHRGDNRLPAAANLALEAGDRLVTGPDSRADIRLGANRSLRLERNSHRLGGFKFGSGSDGFCPDRPGGHA